MISYSTKIIYKELLDKYYSLIRRTSFIHINVISKFEDKVNFLIDEIDNLILDDNNFGTDKEFVLKFRKLIFKLDNILNVDVLNEYNDIIDNLKSDKITSSSVVIDNSVKFDNDYDKGIDSYSSDRPNVVWENVATYLKDSLNVHTYNVWVKPAQYHSCKDNVINIAVQNSYFKNWLDEHCSSMIKEHLNNLNLEYNINFITA